MTQEQIALILFGLVAIVRAEYPSHDGWKRVLMLRFGLGQVLSALVALRVGTFENWPDWMINGVIYAVTTFGIASAVGYGAKKFGKGSQAAP